MYYVLINNTKGGAVMTFLELQRRIVQTRKARIGIRNKEYYFHDVAVEDFMVSVYRKALSAANQVVHHCIEVNQIEKFSIMWNAAYEIKKQAQENMCLQAEVNKLKKELHEANEKLQKSNRGGRHKDYEKEHRVVKYKQENPAATVREIAKALKISTTTVQRALVVNKLNKHR